LTSWISFSTEEAGLMMQDDFKKYIYFELYQRIKN